MKNMKNFLLFGLLSVMSAFSQNDAYEYINIETQEKNPEREYYFAPDEGSSGVEVAPLDGNSEDENIPIPEETVDEYITIKEED